jgi:hypothetical protein
MAKHLADVVQTPDGEWVTFPGGELEGKRPKRLCHECRDRLNRAQAGIGPNLVHDSIHRQPICFQCYRVELDHEKALKSAGELHTASDARFQYTLPWEPVNVRRLSTLKVERAAARAAVHPGTGRFDDRRRHAQIAARHALQAIAAGLREQRLSADTRERVMAAAMHAAELQLPESWLPFVVGR